MYLWAQATPYLRYRMEDVVIYDPKPCPCGNTHMKIKYLGRFAWCVNVRGRLIFTDDVEDVLWRYSELEMAPYQLVRMQKQPQDNLVVRVAAETDRMENLEALRLKVVDGLEKEFGLPIQLEYAGSEEVAAGELKFLRLVERKG